VRGLLLKDFYVLLRQMRALLLVVIIFAVIPGSSLNAFAVIYAAMLPYTALAYDERSHWDQLAGTMPYAPWELVLSKYVLGWSFTAGAAALCLLAGALERPFTDSAADPASVGLAFCIGLLLMAVTLPLMFLFGVERGRMLFILLSVVIACSCVGAVSGTLVEGGGAAAALTLLLPAGAAVLTAVSVPVSVRLYIRRLCA